MSTDGALSFQDFTEYLADGLSLDPEALTKDASFDEDLGIDSFDMVELIVRVEELGAHLPEEAVMSIVTVGDLYEQYTSRVRIRRSP